jgi:UDP-glucose 4-epimerase
MKILFTGASSFTGYWFIRELTRAGHDVVAVFRHKPNEYKELRKRRVDELLHLSHPVFECQFGEEKFIDLLKGESRWDLFCHHAAEVTNYKSPDFDILSALKNNTNNLRAVLTLLAQKNCRRMVLTGTFFEQDEGAGSDDLRAFSPYGVSKGITAEVIKYYALSMGIKLGKFVIPNPFGPYEEDRLTSYLVRSWFRGDAPRVLSPAYVRDNIHVSLLGRAYAAFAESLGDTPSFEKLNPSGYRESVGEFAARFAREMRKRLSLRCEFGLADQTDFPEPKVRVNTDVLDAKKLGWSEEQAWDDLANYYRETFSQGG